MTNLLAIVFIINSLAVAGGSKEPHAFVFKPDASKQCEANSGISLETMERELKDIKVFSKAKGDDGKMYAAVCGGKTGRLNVYEITQKDLAKALNLGFTEKK